MKLILHQYPIIERPSSVFNYWGVQLFMQQKIPLLFQKMASNRDTRKRLFFKYSQEDLQKAIAEHEKGVSMRMAAKKFQIPLGTLFNKVRGLVPNQRRMMGPSTILSVEEEGLIVNWLKASAKKGIPIIKRTLLETVKDIVKQDKRENPFTNDMPGRAWLKVF